MSMEAADIVVAGHVCLDVIPQFEAGSRPGFEPGSLTRVGPAMQSTGGAVANVGLALHRLGMKARLAGKIGDDAFGDEILRILRENGAGLADGMLRAGGEVTSYSIVVNPPGRDRFFLHCPGANDTYCADDMGAAMLDGAKVLHFGYPPLMRRMYEHDGRELARGFSRARSQGLATSLDMCAVDPTSEAGAVDWVRLMEKVLPEVDLFVPSYDETAVMLGEGGSVPTRARLAAIGERLIGYGAAVVMLKLGEQGLYVRTSEDADRIARVGRAGLLKASDWTGREIVMPCFKVNVAGTTGSGDCTIAGFLTGVVKGQSAESAAKSAAAVGACSVEAVDACSGVRSWQAVQQRIAEGWKQYGDTL